MKLVIIILFLLVFPPICFSKALSPLQTPAPQNEIDAPKPTLSQPQENKWSKMTGKWFGQEGTKNGGRVMWIAERNNDGTYKIHFRVVGLSGEITDQIEVGEWGVSGPVYFTIFKARIEGDKIIPVDPTNPYNRDAYKIIRLNEEYFEYEAFDSGNKFSVRKVPIDFVFPK